MFNSVVLPFFPVNIFHFAFVISYNNDTNKKQCSYKKEEKSKKRKSLIEGGFNSYSRHDFIYYTLYKSFLNLVVINIVYVIKYKTFYFDG